MGGSNGNGSALRALFGRLFGRRERRDEPVGMLDPRAFDAALSVERSRADRTGRPFSLVVACQAACAAGGAGAALRRLARVFLERKRCTDIVGWVAPGRLGVILPHTSGQDAWRMLHNIRSRLVVRGAESRGREQLCYCVHTYAFGETPAPEDVLQGAGGVSEMDLAEGAFPAAWPPGLKTLRTCAAYGAGRAYRRVAAAGANRSREWPPASSEDGAEGSEA